MWALLRRIGHLTQSQSCVKNIRMSTRGKVRRASYHSMESRTWTHSHSFLRSCISFQLSSWERLRSTNARGKKWLVCMRWKTSLATWIRRCGLRRAQSAQLIWSVWEPWFWHLARSLLSTYNCPARSSSSSRNVRFFCHCSQKTRWTTGRGRLKGLQPERKSHGYQMISQSPQIGLWKLKASRGPRCWFISHLPKT